MQKPVSKSDVDAASLKGFKVGLRGRQHQLLLRTRCCHNYQNPQTVPDLADTAFPRYDYLIQDAMEALRGVCVGIIRIRWLSRSMTVTKRILPSFSGRCVMRSAEKGQFVCLLHHPAISFRNICTYSNNSEWVCVGDLWDIMQVQREWDVVELVFPSSERGSGCASAPRTNDQDTSHAQKLGLLQGRLMRKSPYMKPSKAIIYLTLSKCSRGYRASLDLHKT